MVLPGPEPGDQEGRGEPRDLTRGEPQHNAWSSCGALPRAVGGRILPPETRARDSGACSSWTGPGHVAASSKRTAVEAAPPVCPQAVESTEAWEELQPSREVVQISFHQLL
ncbi:hypothetical protein NDU88_006772 [Pleurodeles waltl]|uniref:Uncharacterized protein n=1 Tax=Pleurodeles waltl TaxID=8319 RepID=A0AAV7N088_PLEWA|nr:hypothetical protein NDU88_006772 [Pleurodeles waltl]